MRVRSAISIAMVTVSGFVGCTSSGSGSSPSPSGPVELADFPEVYANALCDNLGTCCTQNGYGYDVNKCKAAVKAFTAMITSQVQGGGVKYDASAAGSCMAEVPGFAKSCMESDLDSTACRNVFAGTVAVGGACKESSECIEPAGGQADCDQGKCVVETRGVAGDACKWSCTDYGSATSCSGAGADTGARCFTNDGLYCDSATNKCAKRLAQGAQGCDATESCVDGAYCESQTCVAQKALGVTCSSDDQCTSSAYCDQTCLAKKPLGAACTDQYAGEECIDGACDAGKCAKDKNSSMGIFCGG